MSEQLNDEKLAKAINDLGLIVMIEHGEYVIKFMGRDGKVYIPHYYPQVYPDGTEYHEVTVFRANSVQTWNRK